MKDRQLLIIKKLLGKERLSIDELSRALKVSSRTIRNDVIDINEALNNWSITKISNKRGQLDFSLNSKEKHSLSHYLEIRVDPFPDPKKRQLDIIVSFLKAPHQVKIYEVQERLHISKSTMDKDMRQVRRFLAKYSLTLNTQQGAKIVGAERNIRTMIQQLIVENVDISRLREKSFEGSDSNKIVIDYLNPKVLNQTDQVSKQLILGSRYEGVSAREAQVSVLMAIWIRRVQEQQYLDESPATNLEVADTRIQKSLNELLKKLKLEVPENEKSYMTFILKNFLGEKEVRLDKWNKSELLTLQLIDYMSEVENIDYRDSEPLYEQLNFHISAFLQRQENHIEIYNPLTDVLKTSYTTIYQDVSAFFQRKYDKSVSEGEKAYITVYFSTYYEEIIKENDFYRIAVLCNYGEATGQLLAANISRNMNVEVVAVLGLQDIRSLKKLNIDFVVKTIDEPTDAVPSFKMPLVPKQSDYQALKNFITRADIKKHILAVKQHTVTRANLLKDVIALIEAQTDQAVSSQTVDKLINIFSEYRIDIKEREVRPMLQDLLTDDKIQIHLKANNWCEAIEKASQPLLENKAINAKYIAAMEDSVKKFGPYIVIGPGIALAHARPEDGAAKLDVSVASLAEPIEFGNKANDPVKIIFVLSAIDSYSHLNVLKTVVNLINKPNKIDELCQKSNKASFKATLFGDDRTERSEDQDNG
ncbi:BglG family transcription antiterminator [Lactobacillus xylocopicola]|uniref:Transcriptional antiterminator n=1 Tax=Lactobacillus xylocopicola TaxID=2976676 RepID=A0ABN6SNH8_9LACO|nr:PTS sugar transporter subunit IIA [Lactobacillus xylocopicola]BDR61179.1 transcriptional antiterminator [Lactobacillus xylocopicola]